MFTVQPLRPFRIIGGQCGDGIVLSAIPAGFRQAASLLPLWSCDTRSGSLSRNAGPRRKMTDLRAGLGLPRASNTSWAGYGQHSPLCQPIRRAEKVDSRIPAERHIKRVGVQRFVGLSQVDKALEVLADGFWQFERCVLG